VFCKRRVSHGRWIIGDANENHGDKGRTLAEGDMMGATISRDDLKGKIKRHDKFILMETLAPEAYAQAHLPGAVNAPVSQIQELAPKLAPAKDAEIVVYCASPT